MASEEKLFENVNGCTDRRTHAQMDDRQKVITRAHPEHSSDELKTIINFFSRTKKALKLNLGIEHQGYKVYQTYSINDPL